MIVLQRILRWTLGIVQDPISADLSSARVAGLTCLVVGCTIALKHPDASGTVAALIGGGAVAFLSRVKSDA